MRVVVPALTCLPLTGGTLCACLDALLARGATLSNIRVVGAVAAPPALKRLSEGYPGAMLFRSRVPAALSLIARAVCRAAGQACVCTCP